VLPQPVRLRLAPELATALAGPAGRGTAGARTLARRLAAQIWVHGGGRVAASLASLLTASGIGRVSHAGGRAPRAA